MGKVLTAIEAAKKAARKAAQKADLDALKEAGKARKAAAATAVAGTALAPEEAEAGPLLAGARRILDDRFLSALGGSPPRVGLRDAVTGMETGIRPRTLGGDTNLDLADFEGHPYILTQSDRSAAGGEITSVHGTPINPVDLRGGRDFMLDPPSEGQVWASDPAVVKSLYGRADALSREHGSDTILLPYSMAPTGIDFATMPLETMVGYARERMSKTNIKKLDRKIKAVIPGWRGIADPASPAIFRDVKGPSRKKVADIIDKDFRDVPGGMSISEARAATSDTAQYLSPEGQIANVGRIDTSRAVIPDSGHPTYRGGLPGEGVGKLANPLDVRPFMANNGRQLTGNAADIRALSMNHGLSQGVIDEKLLNAVYGQGGAADPKVLAGIAAGTAGVTGLLAQDAEAGPISRGGKTLLETWHGGPHKYKAERLIRRPDGTEEFIEGGVDALPDIPEGARVLEDFPLGRMRMDKIGTGEGAQAYGHGLYSADSEGVARGYREELSKANARIVGPDDVGDSVDNFQRKLFGELQEQFYRDIPDSKLRRIADTIGFAKVNGDDFGHYRRFVNQSDWDEVEKAANIKALDYAENYKAVNNEGALYRTEIDVDPDTLLDWDKPLSEQPEILGRLRSYVDNKTSQKGGNILLTDGYTQSIDEALKYPEETKGWDIYSTLADYKRSGDSSVNQQQATAIMAEAGIPGIRYLDGASRSAGDGSYNYVMFDAAPISIKERGAANPALLAATAAGTAGLMGAAALSPQQALASYGPDSDEYVNSVNKALEQERITAMAVDFSGRRVQKRTYWQSLRDDVVDIATQAAEGLLAGGASLLASNPVTQAMAFGATQMPWSDLEQPVQGVAGLAAAGAGLAQGQGVDQALQQGANVAQMPQEQIGYEAGGLLADQGHPLAGYIANVGISATGI